MNYYWAMVVAALKRKGLTWNDIKWKLQQMGYPEVSAEALRKRYERYRKQAPKAQDFTVEDWLVNCDKDGDVLTVWDRTLRRPPFRLMFVVFPPSNGSVDSLQYERKVNEYIAQLLEQDDKLYICAWGLPPDLFIPRTVFAIIPQSIKELANAANMSLPVLFSTKCIKWDVYVGIENESILSHHYLIIAFDKVESGSLYDSTHGLKRRLVFQNPHASVMVAAGGIPTIKIENYADRWVVLARLGDFENGIAPIVEFGTKELHLVEWDALREVRLTYGVG